MTIAVEFISEPADVVTYEGSTAYFNCSFSGIRELPLWFINSFTYPVDFLPDSRYSYVNRRLKIRDVRISDNGTVYACIVGSIMSRSGILQVIPIPNGMI